MAEPERRLVGIDELLEALRADPNGGDGTGSKDRTTVALVGAKVDAVKEIVARHAEVTQLKLEAINDKVTPLANIPERVARLEVEHFNLRGDVEELQKTAERRTDRQQEADEARRQRKWDALRGVLVGAAIATFGYFINNGFHIP